MDFTTFVRKPFTVEAVEITEDNIEEIAKHVGTLKHKPDGTPFIKVNKNKVPNVYQVFPGFWMTRMDDNIRCYSPRIFEQQFSQMDDDTRAWIAYMERPDSVAPVS